MTKKRQRLAMPPRAMDITRETASAYRVSMEDMFSRVRTRRIASAHAECWRRIREEMLIDGKPPSYPNIGDWFRKNHSSVFTAVKNASTVEGRANLERLKLQYQCERVRVENYPQQFSDFGLKAEPIRSILKRGTGAFAAPLPTVANT